MAWLTELQYWISAALVIAGTLFVVLGGVALLRMPDLFTRMHGGSLTDTAGAGFILVGLMIYSGFNLVSVKLLLILLFLLFTSPVGTHALAQAALVDGVKPKLHQPRDGDRD